MLSCLNRCKLLCTTRENAQIEGSEEYEHNNTTIITTQATIKHNAMIRLIVAALFHHD